MGELGRDGHGPGAETRPFSVSSQWPRPEQRLSPSYSGIQTRGLRKHCGITSPISAADPEETVPTYGETSLDSKALSGLGIRNYRARISFWGNQVTR